MGCLLRGAQGRQGRWVRAQGLGDVIMSLIALSDVERVFNAGVVASLARTAKLPAEADIDRFGESIRIAGRIFLEAKSRLNAPQLRTAIERLYQLNTRAEQGSDRAARALARAVDVMPADVRQ